MKKMLCVFGAVLAAASGLIFTACGAKAEGGDELNRENLATLKGKTVGVAQLNNVPGLTLQATLKKHGVDYVVLDGLQAPKSEDKVNLVAVEAEDMSPALGCDYYLCPEPTATVKINGTKGKPVSLVYAGSLQELYGGEEGYPQAVLVAKNDLAGDTVTGELVSSFAGNAQYLASAQTAEILSLLAEVRTSGLKPAFGEQNLNAEVVANCSVRYVPAADHKEKVNAFLGELAAVNANAAKAVSDEFYYTGDFTAQPQNQTVRKVYVPDGAPALGIVNALSQKNAAFEFHVIDAQAVAGYVTGASPAADYCVLPVNLASKLLGSGDAYRMLGTVTNGNLYFLTVKNA